ncbi:hypothetical protein [Neorhodopirellula pilleata]|uniref:Uncharacterized protein n=1 Tax=Neorhodopirellula pilleata TaxID=2714738 RepID=A0A5C6A756_9BACT|nr:hypothetical protein [Neorhodopirellula pilleata]TWT94183.1 hypothetical protein Pla100_37930 [Neorhodopirellula pilleata]
MNANPYQSSHLIESPATNEVSQPDSLKLDEMIPESARRISQAGRFVLTGYFVILPIVWLALAYSFHQDTSLNFGFSMTAEMLGRPSQNSGRSLSRYIQSHELRCQVLLGVISIGLLGGVLCSFTPRRERVYLWIANVCKVLLVAVAFRVLSRVHGGAFSMNLLTLFLAVLYAFWLIGEAALLGFLRASVHRQDLRWAAHGCESAIGLLALSAGCFSTWALLGLPLSNHLGVNLLIGMTASFTVAQLIALYVLRWHPIIARASTQSPP